MKFLWDIPNDREYVVPEKFVRYMAERMGVRRFHVHKIVLMTFLNRVLENLVRGLNAKPLKKWIYSGPLQLYDGKYKRRNVSVTSSFIGAPGTVMLMEELIACGADKFIFIGAAGGLRREAHTGTIILPTEAIREEGTSYHYLPEEVKAKPDTGILSALEKTCKRLGVKYVKGKVWTTDAVYREMKSKIDFYSEKSVYAVDMEASAIFSLATYRGVKAGIILVVSDELFHEEWKPLFLHKRLLESLDKVSRVALEAASTMK